MTYILISELDMANGDTHHEFANSEQAAIERAKQLINGRELKVVTISDNGGGKWNVFLKDI